MSAGRSDESLDLPLDSFFDISAAQRGIYFAQQALGAIPMNIAQYVELVGHIDADLLSEASQVAGREMGSAYLSLVETDALPLQYIDNSIDDGVEFVDLSGDQDPHSAAQRWMREDYRRPVDLLADRLTVSALLRLGEDHYFWYVRTHHIALDGFGAMNTVTRIAEVYTALVAGREPAPVKAAALPAIVADERKYRDSDRFAKDREYWSERTVDLPGPLSLSQRRAGPGDHSQLASATLPDDIAAHLDEAAGESGGSTAPAVIAAFAAYLARMTDSEDVVLSLPVSGRNTAKLRRAGGMVSNIVPLRLTVAPDTTISRLITDVQTELTGALRRQLYRHEDIRRDIGQGTSRDIGQGAGRRGLFGPSVNLMMFHPVLELGDVVGHLHVLTTGPVEDLSMNLYPGVSGSNLRVDFEANPQLYTEAELTTHHQRFTDFLGRLLAAGPDTPVGSLPLGSPAELAATMVQPNDTEHPIDSADLIRMWEHQVGQTPEATAFVDGPRRVSFAEFDSWTNRLARHLISAGVGPDVTVGVALRRSLELVASVYAVLKAGGAYVPIDPDHPRSRTADVLRTAAPRCVVVTGDDRAVVADSGADLIDLARIDLSGYADGPLTDDERRLRPDGLAYVLFTSGSTGKPKGVAVPHRAVANQMAWLAGHYGIGHDDVVLQKTPTTFDVSVWELFAPTVGARLVIARPDGHLDPDYLLDVITAEQITATSFVPSMLQLFLGENGSVDPGTLRLLLVAGEAFGEHLARQAARDLPGVRVENLYGPTEFTVHATFAPTGPDVERGVPIGRPVWNCQAWVLDRRLRPCVVGAVGELYLSGDQLTRGYLGRAELTAERYVPSAYGPAGTRMYRTGDLVRWSADGSLEYLGRSDFQVKVRGLRIELGEIESAVRSDTAVREAVVTVHESEHGQRLVVYVVGAGTEDSIDTAALMTTAAGLVPDYMLPDAIIELPQMPLGPSGKIDRKALPTPDFSARTTAFRPPTTDRERALAGLVGDLLGQSEIGLDDSFFALGGDSIMSIQLVSRARAMGLHFTAREVFEHNTIGALAAVARDEGSASVVNELPGGGVGELPLTPIMWWMADEPENVRAFSQSVLVPAPEPFSTELLDRTLSAVVAHHDILRSRLVADGDGTLHHIVDPVAEARSVPVSEITVDSGPGAAAFDEAVAAAALDATESLDPASGRIISVTVVSGAWASDVGHRLLIVLHHLAVDGVTWRILLPDLATAWAAAAGGDPVVLAPTGTSMRRWAHHLTELSTRPELTDELDHWRSVLAAIDEPDLRIDPERDRVGTLRRRQLTLPAEITDALLTRVPQAFHGGVNDGLLAALALAATSWSDERRVRSGAGNGAPQPSARSVVVALEGHGREEELLAGSDLSRTAGWFTTAYPVLLRTEGIDVDDVFAGGSAAGDLLKSIKEQLAAVPRRGVGYGLLRYLNDAGASELSQFAEPVIGFNYLGRLSGTGMSGPWIPDGENALRGTRGTAVPVRTALDINAMVTESAAGPQFSATIEYPAALLDDNSVDRFLELWHRALESVALHAVSPEAGGRTPSDLPLVDLRQSEIDEIERRFDLIADVWPVTPLQQGLLFHAELAAGGLDVYAAQMVLDLTGVDPDRMRRSTQALIDRHPNLRTAFVTSAEGTPLSVVVPRVDAPWTDHDLSGVDEDDREARVAELTHQDRVAPFEMHEAPLIRFMMIKCDESSYRFVVTNHHILLDGWSLPIFMGDLLAIYRAGGDATTLTPPAPYRDYLRWLRSQSADAASSAWAAALAGVSEPTSLAAASTIGDAGQVPQVLDVDIADDVTARLTEHVRNSGTTLNTVLQAAWGIVLARLTGRDDVIFGTTVSGRPPQVPGIESMLGLFINTLPVRVRLDDDADLGELIKRLGHEQTELLDHHTVGLADITATTDAEALFDTMMVYESYPLDRSALAAAAAIDGMAVTGADVLDAAHYPLTLIATNEPGLRLSAKYLPSVVDHDRAESILQMVARVLGQIAADPSVRVGRLDVLATPERAELLGRYGSGDTAAATLPELLAEAVAAGADRDAAVSAEGSITYPELDARSNALARLMISRGVGPDQIVALGMGRSIEFLVGLWAVAKTGAGYLPVDMHYPAERIAHMLTDSGAVYGLSTSLWRSARPDTLDWLELDSDGAAAAMSQVSDAPVTDAERTSPVRTAHTAYMIYTSGTTGLPKGVTVTHGGLANLMHEQSDHFALTGNSRTLHFASPSFDASVLELMLALAHGATMVIAPTGIYGGAELHDFLSDHGVTHAFVTPAALASVDPTGLDSLETVVVGGEACPPELVARWAPGRRMFNAYGPTETTVVATIAGPIDPAGVVTIGSPVRGLSALVLDRRLQPVPVGVDGELFLSGPAIARGYHNRTALTAERFIGNPHGAPGTRMYRTGDVVRWVRGGSGDLEVSYVGRRDFQVKVRGFRIELGEVDAALAAHPDIDFAVTSGAVLPSGVTTLVAHVLASKPLDTSVVREFVGERLPSHMVPAVIVFLSEVPLTRAGKLDRSALPEPDLGALVSTGAAPSTETERMLAAVLTEVLGLTSIGVSDSFFDLGGNSLVATKAAARISAQAGRRVAVREIFENPTVESLARRLDVAADDDIVPELVAGAAGERPPLSLAQQAMWLLNRLDPQSPAYNIVLPLRLFGELDVDALQAAILDVLERQQSLRSVFPDTAHGPYQRVLPAAAVELELDPVDVADEEQMLSTAEQFARGGFDVTDRPPVRARLLRSGAEHLLIVVVHHIVADGASMAPLARDLVTAYAARTTGTDPRATWTPLPVQYVDYATWQREVLGSPDDAGSLAARQLDFWRTTLAGVPDVIDLPLDRPRPVRRTMQGASVPVTIPGDVVAALGAYAQRRQASVFMVVHTIVATLLARLSGSSDITVGTPVGGREHVALDDLVGMFVNTVVLRSEIGLADTFDEVFTRVREADLAAFANDDIPFESVAGALVSRRQQSHSPLFQVLLSFENNEAASVDLPGLTVGVVDGMIQGAKFDLTFTIEDTVDADGRHRLGGRITYATDVFDHGTVSAIAARFETLAGAVATNPAAVVGDIDILTEAEHLEDRFGEGDRESAVAPVPAVAGYSAADLAALLAAAVDIAPDAVALDADGAAITYRDFRDRFDQLAGPLGERGMDADAIASVVLTSLVPTLVAIPDGFAVALDNVIADAARLLDGRDLAGYRSTPATAQIAVPGVATPLTEWDQRVRENPGAQAVRSPEASLTRLGLDAAANQLARELVSRGIGPDDVVGLLTARSANWIIGLLAAWKAGAAYLPLDPTAPADRAASVVADAGARVVVASHEVVTDDLRAGIIGAGGQLIELGDTGTDDALRRLDDSGLPDRWSEPGAELRLAYVITTSGSTGRPKPTLVPAGGLLNMWGWYRDQLRFGDGDAVLIASSPRFDLTQKNIWTALRVGGVIRLVTEGFDPEEILGIIGSEDISLLNLAPSALELLTELDSGNVLRTLDTVATGGEALGPRAYRTLLGTETAMLSMYGPTETAATTAARWVPLADHEPNAQGETRDIGPITLGQTIPNVTHKILDQRLRPVPIGVVGELYIGGVALARGYGRLPGVTAGRFVADPAGGPGARMYRTGDLVRRLSGGDGLFIGRSDFQVKVRGLRIELGEIESALIAVPGVRQAVVSAHGESSDRRLAAHVAADRGLDMGVVRGELSKVLPDYMVPEAIVVMDVLPLNPNGKIDRKSLRAPEFGQDLGESFVAPRTPLEEIIAGVFADTVGVDRVSATASFFEQGGNSLSAARLANRLTDALGTTVGLRDVFDATSPAELADLVERRRTEGTGRAPGAVARFAKPEGPAPERIPLSLAQQRLWFINRYDPQSGAYNIPMTLLLTGELDVEALGAALVDLVERQHVMRTVYPQGPGGPEQVVVPLMDALPPFRIDVIARDQVWERLQAFARIGFDVTTTVPFRSALWRIEPDPDITDAGDHGEGADTREQHLLVIVVHHIASDGLSMRPMATDLLTAYEARRQGRVPDWAPLAVQYTDFAIWQHKNFGAGDTSGGAAAAQLDFWREELAGMPEVIGIPTDRPRANVRSDVGGSHLFFVPADLHRRVVALAGASGLSSFMVLHAAVAILLARSGADRDVALGTPVGGRAAPELDPVVGMFVNTLVLRTDVPLDRTVRDFLSDVRARDLDAFDHSDVPFEQIVDALTVSRSTAHTPLIQVVFGLNNNARPTFELEGLEVTPGAVDTAFSKFDLSFELTEQWDDNGAAAGLAGFLGYATDIFDQPTAQRLTDRLLRILDGMVADSEVPIGEIDLLDDRTRAELVPVRGGPVPEPATLIDLLDHAAAGNPDGIALICGDQSMTYRELDNRSNRLARELIARGLGPEDVVALGITRSIESVLAVWAVARSGAAFVPVDPNYPTDRVSHMLADSGATVGITRRVDALRLPEVINWLDIDDPALHRHPGEPIRAAERHAAVRVSNCAYIIYTSGTTGKPKGVEVTHRGLAAFSDEQRRRYRTEQTSRTL
ncbi:amino acid adenylation domain-containing protein, partial [Williamsia sp.]|uniref:amino acid adenylation domain-containing protein n=1 Tax=Williamsia sp. TaxID=1872085 RepID=UPI002F92D11D